jgi:hypothetical protein
MRELWEYIQNSAYSLERLESGGNHGGYVKVQLKNETYGDISSGYAAVQPVLIPIEKLV